MRTCLFALFCLWLAGCGFLPGGGSDAGGTPDGGGGGMVQPRFSSLYSTYLTNCKACHAPMAPGHTAETEKSLDFTSATTAYSALVSGKATGLVGNQMDCNGVAFVVKGQPGQSLLVAVLDQTTRMAFSAPGAPKCDRDAVSDMAFRVAGNMPAGFIAALKQWITDGAANN